ncbi:MAG TPA: tetratricopeptide repeat protein, partial [Bacteroidia bacterium]|nr:tetratricopeptide repeat protein [Bacteroidia bacterium]
MKRLFFSTIISLVLISCSQKSESSDITIVLGGQADSVVHDTVFQNFVVDSLKKSALSSQSDSSLINALCLLAQNSTAKNRIILGNEIILHSHKLGYKREELRGELLLANYLIFQQKYTDADSALNSILQKAADLKDEYILSRAYLQKAEAFRLGYKFDSAEVFYKRALDLSLKNNDEEIIAFVNSTWSNIFDKRGDYKKALEMDSIAISIAQKLNDHARLSFTLSNMGEIYRIRGDLPKALDCMQQSLHFGTLINNKRRIVLNLITIGHIYTMEDDFVNAEKNYLAASEKVAESDKINLATITSS